MSITPADYAAGIGTMLEHARSTGGGRTRCCQRGQCATHLAEGDRGHVSTVHLGHGTACFPETEGQALTIAAAAEVYAIGLRILGLDPEAFIGDAA